MNARDDRAAEEQRRAMVESLRRLVTAWEARRGNLIAWAAAPDARDRGFHSGAANRLALCISEICSLAGIEAPGAALDDAAPAGADPEAWAAWARDETPADRAQQSAMLRAAELARRWLTPRLNMLARLEGTDVSAMSVTRARGVADAWRVAIEDLCMTFGIPEPQPQGPGADDGRALLQRDEVRRRRRHEERRAVTPEAPPDDRTPEEQEASRARVKAWLERPEVKAMAAELDRPMQAFIAWHKSPRWQRLVEQAGEAPRDIARGAFLAGWRAHEEQGADRPEVNDRKGFRAESAPEPITPGTLFGVYSDIFAERYAQDLKWGGPSHDDAHDASEWVVFIQTKLDRAEESDDDADYRRRMVQVAALAVAAVESLDRHRAQVDAPAPTVEKASPVEPQVYDAHERVTWEARGRIWRGTATGGCTGDGYAVVDPDDAAWGSRLVSLALLQSEAGARGS